MPGLFDRLQEDLEQREKMAGMSPADLLLLPDDEVAVVQLLARRGDLSLEAITAALDLPAEEVQASLDRLRERGFARPIELPEGAVYRTYFARKRKSAGMGSLWDQLAERVEGGSGGGSDPEGDREGGGDRDRGGDRGVVGDHEDGGRS